MSVLEKSREDMGPGGGAAESPQTLHQGHCPVCVCVGGAYKPGWMRRFKRSRKAAGRTEGNARQEAGPSSHGTRARILFTILNKLCIEVQHIQETHTNPTCEAQGVSTVSPAPRSINRT